MATIVVIEALSPQTAIASSSVTVKSIVDALKNGQSVDLKGVNVMGDLDLRALVEINRVLRCQSCHLLGALVAEDVVFNKVLDLSGSQFDGPVDLAGATFETAANFREVGGAPTRFAQATSFAGAVFANIASFAGAIFVGDADFTTARFQADARFDNADFQARAAFEATVFEGPATFSSLRNPEAAGRQPTAAGSAGPCLADRDRGAFEAEAAFTRARMRSGVDFRLRCFGRAANFSEMDLADRLDMTQAHFAAKATFDNSRMAGGASFRVVRFDGDASFDGVAAARDLEFTGAEFRKGASAIFFRLSGTGSLILQDVAFTQGSRIDTGELSVHRLSLNLDQVHWVGSKDDQRRVLGLVEEGARAAGDLSTANRAHYDSEALAGMQRGPFLRALDGLFYRRIFGYFVRPLQPLVALAVVILVIAFFRRDRGLEAPDSRPADPGDKGTHVAPRAPMRSWFGRPLVRYLHRVERTVSVAASKSPPRKEEKDPVTIPSWLEFLLYKVLTIAVLLGVANSNETLRQMLRTIK